MAYFLYAVRHKKCFKHPDTFMYFESLFKFLLDTIFLAILSFAKDP